MYCDIICILTHTVSQLLYRWFVTPKLSNCGLSLKFENIHALSIDDWRDIFCLELKRNPNSCLQIYQNKYKDHGLLFAQTAFNNTKCLRENNASYITFFDPRYPPSLKAISDFPVCLTIIGNQDLLLNDTVSIIGSRKASVFALNETYKLGYLLSSINKVVVSGGALGCDIAAHDGALKASAGDVPAIVVFAGGLSEYYPRQNYKSFTELKNKNALFLSERLWNHPAKAFDFPVRNRIISGLSDRTIVMQAMLKSGAMITAQKALDQGRDVFVLLHDKNDVRSEGNFELFRQGAKGFTSAEGYMREEFYAH